MMKWIRGTRKISVFGAAPERCVNRWISRDLPFWSLERKSEMEYLCSVYSSDYPALVQEANRAQCDLKTLYISGLPVILSRLRPRAVLVSGVLLAVLLVLLAQNYVWFVQIRGTERIPEGELKRALAEEGVRFGAWGPDLEPEELKNRLLNRVPTLRWLAVNREGALVTVLCAERKPEEPALDTAGITDLIAVKPGVVRELHVINGFAQTAPGEIVMPGDILISGTMEWTTHIQATHAEGEVYADTLNTVKLVCPSAAVKKRYTGRTETVRTIIFQRNRRKLSGNSGIFGTMCDRMIETTVMSLPGGFELPLVLETETLLEYRLEPIMLSEDEAKTLLESEAVRRTTREMVSGTIEAMQTRITKQNNRYCCVVGLNCLELISKTVPAVLFGEEEEHGETDKRGTN